jgi:hypothetical protein
MQFTWLVMQLVDCSYKSLGTRTAQTNAVTNPLTKDPHK